MPVRARRTGRAEEVAPNNMLVVQSIGVRDAFRHRPIVGRGAIGNCGKNDFLMNFLVSHRPHIVFSLP